MTESSMSDDAADDVSDGVQVGGPNTSSQASFGMTGVSCSTRIEYPAALMRTWEDTS